MDVHIDGAQCLDIRASGGLWVGQCVQHKVTGAKAVIVQFSRGGRNARVSVGWYAHEEFTARVAELEAYKEPPAVAAVDPHVPDPGKTTPRAEASSSEVVG